MAAGPAVLKDILDRLYTEFQITTSDTGRFLGMDTEYNLTTGALKMHMATYVEATVQRFESFNISSDHLFGNLLAPYFGLC